MYNSTLQANWMGASPDGLVTNPSERQPYGLVEIKCPACAEKIPLLDQLKKGHNYYYQIQGQLQITCRQWCNFVVWTSAGQYIEI